MTDDNKYQIILTDANIELLNTKLSPQSPIFAQPKPAPAAEHTVPKTPPMVKQISQDEAKEMLKKYRGDLENLANLIKSYHFNAPIQGASRKDSSYIPYIIEALDAIAQNKAFTPKFATSGMGNIFGLPSDPSECLNLLVNKNYEKNFARILCYSSAPADGEAPINFSKKNLEKFAQELAGYFAGPQLTKPVKQPMLQPTVALEQPQPAPAAQHTVPKTPSMVKQISQSQAKDMLQKYRGDLENLSNLVKNGASNHPPEGRKRMDSSYIPYIIEALEAIAQNKAFTPKFATSGMGNIFGLPSDPSECLNLLVNGNHKEDFARILCYSSAPADGDTPINFSKENLEKFAQELASYFAGPQITKPVKQPMLQPTVALEQPQPAPAMPAAEHTVLKKQPDFDLFTVEHIEPAPAQPDNPAEPVSYTSFHSKTPKDQRADLKKLIQATEKKLNDALKKRDSLPQNSELVSTPQENRENVVNGIINNIKARMFSDGMINQETHDLLNIANIKATSAKHQFFKFVYSVLDSVHAAEGWDFKASVYNKMKKAEIIAKVKEITKDIGSKKTRAANSKGGARTSSGLNL